MKQGFHINFIRLYALGLRNRSEKWSQFRYKHNHSPRKPSPIGYLNKSSIRHFVSKFSFSRLLSSSSENVATILRSTSYAPRYLRLSLVALSTSLSTPLIVFMSGVYGWYYYFPKFVGNRVKYLFFILLGGGIYKLTQVYILPFLYNHSDIILPFAFTNGMVATSWYLLGN
jgi:hypothetical protein